MLLVYLILKYKKPKVILSVFYILNLFYCLLALKQSIHFKLLVSLGSKGKEEMLPPQPAHCQSPANLSFSPGLTGTAPAKPSSSNGIGSLANPASSGISKGISSAGVAISGVDVVVEFFFLLQQALQVRPVSLLGWKGSSVIAPPHPLHFQFP